MKIRHREDDSKIDLQMSAMIDIVFQLLIFFMLTLKIIPQEGEFDINMPVAAPTQSDEIDLTVPFKVRLYADAAGNLRDITVGDVSMGNDVPACFQRLNSNVHSWAAGGGTYNDDLEVELDADYALHYQYIIKAVSACTGYVDDQGRKKKFLEKIKFAPPRRPGEAGA